MIRIEDDHRPLFASVVLAAGFLILPAETAVAQAHYVLEPTHSQVTFEANSTTGHFQGRVEEVTGWVTTDDTVAFGGTRGEVRIKVASVRTGIGLRDRHLRGDMQADRFPEVILTVDSVLVDAQPDGHERAVLHATIDFRGVARSKTVAATLRALGDTLEVAGSIPMRFTEFEMKPPAGALGIMRVKDEWEIVFSTRFMRVR